MKYYQHSGAVPFFGLLLTLVLAAVVTLIAGFIYTYLVVYIPFIYLNFFITLGYGAAIGGAVGIGASLGKIRNTSVVTILGFAFALFGIYVEWGFSPMALGGVEFGLTGFDPRVMPQFVKFLFDEGSWSLFGANVAGYFLVAIWVIEIAIIVTVTVLMARAMVSDQPFCERCNEWTETEEGVANYQNNGSEPVWQLVLEGRLERLSEVPPANGDEPVKVRLDLATCKTCPDCDCVTFQVVRTKVDKDGKPEEDVTTLARNLIITRQQSELIREAGRRVEATEPPAGADSGPA